MRTTVFVAPLAAATLLLLTACGGSPSPEETPPAASATTDATTASTTAPATTATAAPLVFTVDGIGPYQLGVTKDSLLGSGLLDGISTGGETCPANTTARGTDQLTDIRLSFRPDGLLYLVVNRSTEIATPSGASLGDHLAQLNSIYSGSTHQVLGDGFYSAFLVRAGSAGHGILFDLGNDDEVFSMAAADADFLHDSYTNGTDYC